MKNTQLAKDIRESLKSQHAYLNQPALGTRTRIYDATAKRDGSVSVKVIQHSPAALGHGKVAWWTVQPNESITIYAGTLMEETFGGGKVRI
jgi:hypothetical protein